MGSWPSPEEVARQGLSTATSLILENIGFSTVSGESLNALTDIMRRFMIGLWSRSKLLAEHAGRTDICPDDMDQTFRKLKFSPMEMRDYLLQVGNVGQPKSICRFPVASPNVRPLFAPRPSAKELEDRAEHIPFYYPAVHPEWTAEGADYLAVMKPSTSTERKGGPADFPDFSNCDAKSIGLLRRGFEGPSFLDTSKDHSSATVGGSHDLSVNIASFRKRSKGSYNYKDHSKCSPSPSPSPSSAQLFKRFEQSSCRSESPSRLTVTLPRKQDQKQLKAITGKAKKAVMPKVESPSSSPMPTLENQSVASVNVTASVDGDSVKKSPSIREDLHRPTPDTESNLPLQSPKPTHDIEGSKEEKKHERREKKGKQHQRKKHPQELCIQQQKEHDEQQLRTANDGMYQKRVGEEVSEESRSCLPETNSDTTTHSMRQEVLEESPKHLKIVISNPHSDSASSAFSPPPQTTRATTETCVLTPSTLDPHHDNDSDTIPFFDDALGAVENMLHKPAPTTFCAENSLDEHSSYLHHKKKKKKDVRREYSASPQRKDKKRDKEYKKKKKKKDHERDRRGRDNEDNSNLPTNESQREPKFTLKIRIGDQTSTTETLAESSPQPEPVKIKFKNLPLEEPREFQAKVVPPLKLGALATHTELKEERAESKRKYYTKAELKASSSYLSAFFVKQSKEETSRKKKDEEERKREKEERRRQEKEERKRIEQEREKEARERERELERGREREVEREREQDLFERKLKEQHEKEKQRRDKDVRLPPPVTAFVKADKKDKRLKEKRRSKEEKKSQVVLEKSVVENNSDEGDDDNSDVVWICPSCSVAWTEGATMVCCDMCDNWFHWHCVGLIIAPPDDVPWFCQKCAGKRQSDKSNKRTGSKLEGSNRKRKKLF